MATKEQLEKHKQFLEDQAAKRRQADAVRQTSVLAADYSGYNDLDQMLAGLTSDEVRTLRSQNASFKKRLEDFDLISAFRRLDDEQQAAFFAEANEATRIVLENDGYVATQTQTLAQSPGEAQDEAEAARLAQQAEAGIGETEAEQQQAEAARIQAETDRVAAEAAQAGVTPAVPRGSVEELYPGVEKLANNAYKLTVDPEDGSSPEIFWGESQKECFIKLRQSKAHATKELRRRKKQLEITDELRAMQVEVVNYAPLMQPISLTPQEFFDLTKQSQDVTDQKAALAAHAKLRLASITPEECARHNEGLERQRYNDAKSVGQKWLTENPDFYPSPENIKELQKLMGELNWAVTEKNLDLAFKTLKEQDALFEAPKEAPPQTQPAPVVPVVAAAVAAPAVPIVQAPAAPAGALPAAKRILRPGSLAETSTGIQPTHRFPDRVAQAPREQPMSAEEYRSYPATDMRKRYANDETFKARVDAYWAAGGR